MVAGRDAGRPRPALDERFLNDGPLALLPLPDRRFALVWTGPRDQVDTCMAMEPEALLARLQEQCPADAPRLTGIGERQRYPLVLTHACAQAVPYGVVVGNAAHTLHPVGDYRVQDQWRQLEPGMALTVEPGLYVAPDDDSVDEQWRGIGIRIEDDVVVTRDGCDVLTHEVPKEVADIEAVMKGS